MTLSLPSLKFRRDPLASTQTQRQLLQALPTLRDFEQALEAAGLWPLRAKGLQTLQINVGKVCNQTCRHCHVDAGPDRKERMTRETMQMCLDVVERHRIPTVDITGGAPELHEDFRWLVTELRARGAHVMDRCNLTVLETPRMADLPAFFAEQKVEVVCSLPHYRPLMTDKQRGEGVYDKSISALKKLNALGYGDGQSGLRLVLVANPVGAILPANQQSLEREWKRELLRLHGIRFDSLYCITNMPISRYLEWLRDSGNLESYVERLANAFNPVAAGNVMCRSMLSVGWDGALYDCDFNQMLELSTDEAAPRHLRDFDLARLSERKIAVARHCYGCTAGAGSSCGGATAG